MFLDEMLYFNKLTCLSDSMNNKQNSITLIAQEHIATIKYR